MCKNQPLSFGEKMSFKGSNVAYLVFHSEYNKTAEERATSPNIDSKILYMLKYTYLLGVQDACREIPDFLSMDEAINKHVESFTPKPIPYASNS